MNVGQSLSKDSETGCPELAIVKLWGVIFELQTLSADLKALALILLDQMVWRECNNTT